MDPREPKSRRPRVSDRLLAWLTLAFLISAAITTALTFLAVRGFVRSWNLGALPSFSLRGPAAADGPSGAGVDTDAPMQSGAGPTAQPWNEDSRVTVLLLGMDHRDWMLDQGPPRTDTMILLTLDPVSRSAGVLSIPRDLWVDVPGFGYQKINTAYRLGEVYEVPGGGPGLTMATVEQLLGVPIHFYALLDFNAFVQFIDEMGGVEIGVAETIAIDPLGPDNTIVLEPGTHLLFGEAALAYARARNTEGSDFDRAERQHQVILAIRDRVMSFDTLTNLVSQAPRLYQEIAPGLKSNLSLDQAIRLAVLAAQIPGEQILRRVIGPEQVDFGTSPGGLDILIPRPEEIRVLRDEIFTTDSVGGPAAIPSEPADLMEAEAARVAVLNGTFTPGLAAETTEYLKSLGVNVTLTGNAAQTYERTTVIDYTGKPYTVQYLVETLDIPPERIFNRMDLDSEVDVEVNLGEDWSVASPTP